MTELATLTAVAVLVGYILGRLRPWHALGDWAADELHFAGHWTIGSRARQGVLAAVLFVTDPRGSWQNWKTSGQPEATEFNGAMKPKGLK